MSSFDVEVEKRPWKILTFYYKEKNRHDACLNGSVRVQVDDDSKKINWLDIKGNHLSNYEIHVLLRVIEELAKEGYKL